MPRDRDREVKLQNNSREFSRNETLAGYWLITHLKFIFHLSFSEAALMAKRTKKVGITGKYGTRYEMHGKIREVIAKPGTAPP